ncbi:MAG: hypothetical protein HKM89_03780 [Gemmatimonadales bacterium]|nr:hypothetical protein [Gemmatimonadales bacterium]
MATPLDVIPPSRPTANLRWRMAQAISLTLLASLVIGLLARPEPTLHVLWNIVLPLLPASLLVSPALWRGICPLATLNTLPNGLMARRSLTVKWAPVAGTIGVVLLALLVPARRFLFNTDGMALAALILAVAVAAVLLGAFYDMKAGFCNSICPILPVERLYGQAPLARFANPRCPDCTLCTPRGCIDLSPSKSVAQTLGPRRRSHAWLFSFFGVFAGAFPGFVLGYFTRQDVPFAAAGSVYLAVGLMAAGSYAITVVVVHLLRLEFNLALSILGAAAAGLYYWFAAPALAEALGLGPSLALGIRIAALALAAIWLARAVQRPSPMAAAA